MPQPSYSFACARISALEKGLFSSQTIRRMADGTIDDAMRQLLDAHYGNMPEATSEDCERMIENVRVQTAETIRELSPEPKLTDLLLLQADVHNLKVLIKARLLQTSDALWLESGLYAREKLTAMVSEQKYDDLPKAMCESLEKLERKLKIQSEPQMVSILVDFGYLKHCLEETKDCKEQFAKQYFEALCDFDNVITFLRMRAMGAQKEDLWDVLLPCGGISSDVLINAYQLSSETLTKALSGSVAKGAMHEGLSQMLISGNISMVEKARDNYLLSLVNEHRHDVMTIFPIVGYYLAREREAKAIRLILTVKRNGLDDSVISERLRELYG